MKSQFLALLAFVAAFGWQSQSSAYESAQGPLKLTGSFWSVWADHDTSKDYLAQANYKTSKTNEIYLGAERLSRAFQDGPLLDDTRFMAGDIVSLSRKWYLENNLTYASAPYFLPALSVQTIPHYIFGDGSEAAMALKFAHYPQGDVQVYSPSYLYPITDTLLIDGQINAVETHHALGSVQGFIQTKTFRNQTLRFTGAGGQSLEALNLEGRFRSFSLNYRWRFAKAWTVEPNASAYRGNLRNEDILGLSLEWNP